MSLLSKLDGEERRSGNDFRFRTVQIQNGNERETRGQVQRAGKELRADIVSPERPAAVRPAAADPDAGRLDRPCDRAPARRRRVLPGARPSTPR